MVEIKEDLANSEKSAKYLQMLCKQRRIRPDKKLFSGLESEKMYLPEELRNIFEEWYNNKMKTVIFPQYRDISGCRKEALKEKASALTAIRMPKKNRMLVTSTRERMALME